MKHRPLVLFLCALAALAGCRQSTEAARRTAFVVGGTPATIYEKATDALTKTTSDPTGLVRIYDSEGMILRFPVKSHRDDSTRLVEISLHKIKPDQTRIIIVSGPLSLAALHDAADREIEESVAKILRQDT